MQGGLGGAGWLGKGVQDRIRGCNVSCASGIMDQRGPKAQKWGAGGVPVLESKV